MPTFAEVGKRLIDSDSVPTKVSGPVATMSEEWQKFFADPSAYLAKRIYDKLKVQATGAANGIFLDDLRLV